MAAFYYDEIKINRKATGNGYTFEARSNAGAAVSKNATSSVISDQGIYEIPIDAKSTDEIVFPAIDIDFTRYGDGQMFGLSNTYPEFEGITDYKGGFVLKDTKYPPPPSSHAINLEKLMQFANSQKVYTPEPVLTGIFEFYNIILTRVIDKTYTLNVTLKDTTDSPMYVFSSIKKRNDDYRDKTVIVLGVKSGTPGSASINFNDPGLYLTIGNKEPGVSIIIYDETDKSSAEINWQYVNYKNGVIYFD